MRVRLALLTLAICCLAPVAGAQSLSQEEAQELLAAQGVSAHPAECARLRRQIDHFTNMQQRAQSLESEMWQSRMAEQVNTLRGIQAARCPNDVPVDTAAQAFAELLKLAAKGAVTYFTFGAAGF
jgi:hypothetical protein